MTFLEFLADKKLLDAKQLPVAQSELDAGNQPLGKVLARFGIEPTALLEAKSEYYGVPIHALGEQPIPFEVLRYVPEESALHYGFAPVALADGFLEVGILNPEDIEAREALNFISAKEDIPYKLSLLSDKDFERILGAYKGLSGQVTQALEELESEPIVDEDIVEASTSGKGEVRIIEDAPVTKIVSTIIRYAVEGNASDIHVEPIRERIRVRFRVDGDLKTSLMLPSKVHSALVARIKVQAKLKLDEKRKPQDGRFQVRIQNRQVDFRVSTFPTYYGEKVVMRILDQEKGVRQLEDIGLLARQKEMLLRAVGRPYGLILISGPTGSGKTTTLYSVLQLVDKEKYNVLSLEDPVEYAVEGVSQSQVFPEIGYTFATGLRTTLRQDPDIIMVGEIRDGETAKLAIQAALTGHLVFSTIHTNTACGIVPRLIDMGVDPYLIPPTLVLGVAQRLVRRNCEGAGEPEKVEGAIKTMIDDEFSDLPPKFREELPTSDTVLRLKPTADCPMGTRGREAVFEMYEMDRDIESVILANPVESAIYDTVRKKGMITMKEHAIVKALEHQVPWEEVGKL
jgi:type IV pilus assembly protein PilB